MQPPKEALAFRDLRYRAAEQRRVLLSCHQPGPRPLEYGEAHGLQQRAGIVAQRDTFAGLDVIQ